MLEFYQAVRDADDKSRNLVMTVLEGRYFGEKALLSNQKIVFQSKENGFFADCRFDEEILNRIDEKGCGICDLDGTAVFCEVLGREKKMVICGGGHVSIPIIQIGRMIGCQIFVLEDRPKFADHARQAGASEVICEPFEEGLGKIEGDQDTFFVIVTRGHRYDQICLESIAKKEHAYIGMIGSRRRAAAVKEAVIANGADADVVNSVYTPIGLAIDAQTPEEIAVAVMAQIIQVKNKQKRSGGFSTEMIETILNDKNKEPKVLATIVERKGSAPREAGSKMLIMADGTCIGTIGGGCAEADLLQKALLMIREHTKDSKLCHVDLTSSDAEEEGMVCGGTIDVLLEVL